MPEEFEAGPPPGEWRNPDEVNRLDDRLFSSILVPLGKGEDDWIALAQALPIARRENAVIKGLHVISEGEDIDSVQVQQVREGFDDRCQEGGVTGQFVVERGKVSNLIVERAAWNDLVVMHLAHPPQPNPIARFRSGFRSVIQRAPRPIIAVSTVSQKLERTLLAFDGSPKAEEALFLSAYVANYWNSDLIVLTSTRNRASTRKSEKRACDYLEEQGIRATFVSRQGDPGELIVETARDYNVDLVIMGGYGRGPIRAMLFGSALETVLRSQGPLTLICR
jgi:nucleotide-binding universal stress UspA family protein